MKRVVVTFAHDNSTYTKLWQRYYKNHFDRLIIVKTGDALKTDWNATTHMINDIQHDLLKYYDLVCFTDMDEFLIPDPDKYKSLDEYLDTVKDPVVRCTGYNVMQTAKEKQLDLTKPILAQRKYWSPDELYNKYVILTKPQVYTSNHTIQNPTEPDPDLVMFHLRDADLDSARERLQSLGRELNEDDLKYRLSIKEIIPNKWKELL